MDLSKLIFKPIFAQVAHPLGDLRGSGNIGLETGPFSSAGAMLNTILSNLLGILTIFAGIWFLIQIVIAGFNFINAQGDPQKVSKANNQITQAVIGIAIVVAGVFLTSLVGELLGLNFLNIVQQINNLAI